MWLVAAILYWKVQLYRTWQSEAGRYWMDLRLEVHLVGVKVDTWARRGWFSDRCGYKDGPWGSTRRGQMLKMGGGWLVNPMPGCHATRTDLLPETRNHMNFLAHNLSQVWGSWETAQESHCTRLWWSGMGWGVSTVSIHVVEWRKDTIQVVWSRQW